MRRWEQTIMSPWSGFLAALLLPGGFLFLALVLYRKYASRAILKG